MPAALWNTLEQLAGREVDLEVGRMLIALGAKERVNLMNTELPEPIQTTFDIAAWRRDKYREALQDYAIPATNLEFFCKDSLENKRRDFLDDFGSLDRDEMYYAAVDFINPCTDLLFGVVGDEVGSTGSKSAN